MGTLVNGIKEIFATAKTTGSNVMLCGNDGTPDGHMTMANLASALGVFVNGNQILSGSFGDCIDSGVYGYNHDSYAASDEPAKYGVLMVFHSSQAGGGNPIAQMFFASNGTIYTRIKSAWTQDAYTAWRTISLS